MYTHAHLRYAEALWRFGDAEGFFEALCLVNPIGMPQRVAGATLRQSNCYYSSSDAAFADRYQASAEFERVRLGSIALEGGWRVYSSGAGIALSLVLRCLLGLRWEHDALVIDPVLPSAFDGMQAELELSGHALHLYYRVGARGCGPRRSKSTARS
jgi:cellobiose phosphorylase